MINVLGDALAAGIMAHICRKDFAQDTGTEVRTVSLREAAETVVPSLWVVTLSRGRGRGQSSISGTSDIPVTIRNSGKLAVMKSQRKFYGWGVKCHH